MGHSESILPVEGAYYGCDTAKWSTSPVLEDDRDRNCAQTVPKISSGLSRFLTFDARCQHLHFSDLRKGREIADSSGESGLQARPQMNVLLRSALRSDVPKYFLDKAFPCVLPVTLSGRSVADDLGAKALAGGLR